MHILFYTSSSFFLCMRIKSKPEDFIVEEINTSLKFNENGKYTYYQLKKINIDTHAAIQQIADCLKINPKYINFAGLKDKTAVTTQYLSISQGPAKDLKREHIGLTYLGNGNERLNLGMLDGNKFTIVVREITKQEKKNFDEKMKQKKTEKKKKQNNFSLQFINYYDDQRFGIHKNNHFIGKLLLKKQFKEAVEMLKTREDYQISLLKKYLEKQPTDIIGALRELPKKHLLLFIHAYQSYLWNETVKEYMKQKKVSYTIAAYSCGELFFSQKFPKNSKNVSVPIIGFAAECDNKDVEKCIKQVMAEEEIIERDFLIKQMPEITAAGGKRDLLMDCKEFSFREIDEETMELCFFLGKGSYATMVVKQLFG